MRIKEKKSWLILLAVIMVPFLCFVIIPLVLYSVGHFTDSIEKVYETNWGIVLPEDIDLLDDKKTRSFHGDGIRHTVYEVSGEEYFAPFETGKNEEIEEMCLKCIVDLQVEKEFGPDFKTTYVWKEYTKYGNCLILIYFPEKREFHLFQQLS